MKKQKRYFLLGQGGTVSYCLLEIPIFTSRLKMTVWIDPVDLQGWSDKKYEPVPREFRLDSGKCYGFLTLSDLQVFCKQNGLKIRRPKLLKKPSIFQLVAKYKPMVQSVKFLTTKTDLSDLTRIAAEQFCKVRVSTSNGSLSEVEFYI